MKHRAVIEAGPAAIHGVCCGPGVSTEAAAALEWIDEPAALVHGHPIAVPQLLRDVLACPELTDAVEVIHPTWWPARRVELVAAAARDIADDVVTCTRATVLCNAFPDAVVVEIAAGLVAVTGARTVAEPRIGTPGEVAAAVVRRVLTVVRDGSATVVIDAPAGVGGAGALAAMIAQRLPAGLAAVVVDELPVRPTAAPIPESPVIRPRAGGRLRLPLAAAAALAVVALGLRPEVAHTPTYLVEGKVALEIPADWPLRRVTAGPGSDRVEVRSPTDPRAALHVTQAAAPGDSLEAVADALGRAVQLAEAQAPGVFVGFDPAGSSAGRPAVTYREIREDHHIDWAVLVDHAVRIGIGCQSGSGGDDALRPVCEQAVRSAHALTRGRSSQRRSLSPLTG